MSALCNFPLGELAAFRNHRRRPKRKATLTVCIAAICNNNTTVFGACDRMLTSGDIEFEPKIEKQNEASRPLLSANPKIFSLTKSIVAMTAGDSGLQSEIMIDTLEEVEGRIKDLLKWLPVKDAVDCYVNAFNAAKDKRIQNEAFTPFGLNADSFIDRQSEMHPQFISDINRRILDADLTFRETHGIEAIVTGTDSLGPHIYIVRGDDVTCCDAVGFAAIGIGARHAESQFMINGHGPYSDREETFLLTYLAKKRSEVAPGVGQGTDMFVAEGLGSITMMDRIQDLDMEKIEAIYQTMEKEQARRFMAAKKKTKTYIDAMMNERAKNAPATASDQQAPPIPGAEALMNEANPNQPPKSES